MSETTALDIRRDASHAIDLKETKRWSAQQLEFQLWLAQPKDERVPSTQQAYAREHDLHEVTLSTWKSLPGFGDEVYELSKRLLKTDKLSAVVNAQADLAISGLPFASTQAAQFVATALGVMPKTGPDIAVQVNNTVYDTGVQVAD